MIDGRLIRLCLAQVATVSLGGPALISFHRLAEDGSAGALLTEVGADAERA